MFVINHGESILYLKYVYSIHTHIVFLKRLGIIRVLSYVLLNFPITSSFGSPCPLYTPWRCMHHVLSCGYIKWLIFASFYSMIFSLSILAGRVTYKYITNIFTQNRNRQVEFRENKISTFFSNVFSPPLMEKKIVLEHEKKMYKKFIMDWLTQSVDKGFINLKFFFATS